MLEKQKQDLLNKFKTKGTVTKNSILDKMVSPAPILQFSFISFGKTIELRPQGRLQNKTAIGATSLSPARIKSPPAEMGITRSFKKVAT